MTLIRKDGTRNGKPTHTYFLDGTRVKGVTTLLSDGLPKPRLTRWAAKSVAEYVADNPDAIRSMHDSMGRESIVSALKSVPWDKRDEAAARGTDIHAIAERVIAGESVEVPEYVESYVRGYVNWLDAWQVTANMTEVTVGRRPHEGVPAYAGTFDADVTMGAGPLAGMRGLVDWKTAKGVYGDNALQLAAYAHADFYLDPNDGSEQAMPVYDFLGVVHLTPTGTDLYLITDPATSWRIFRHVAYLATQKDAIDAQITTPTPMPTIEGAAA